MARKTEKENNRTERALRFNSYQQRHLKEKRALCNDAITRSVHPASKEIRVRSIGDMIYNEKQKYSDRNLHHYHSTP
jgi:hypothetical protein